MAAIIVLELLTIRSELKLKEFVAELPFVADIITNIKISRHFRRPTPGAAVDDDCFGGWMGGWLGGFLTG